MRKIEIKHPEYNKFGQLEKSGFQALVGRAEFPNRIDFQPNVQPHVEQGQTKPDKGDQEKVFNKSLEILSKVFVDGQPLTDLYEFDMNLSSFNPHGYGAANWKYYVVGMKKKTSITKDELKQMVKEMLKEVSTGNVVKSLPGKFVKADKGFNVVNHTQHELTVSIEEYHDGVNIAIS